MSFPGFKEAYERNRDIYVIRPNTRSRSFCIKSKNFAEFADVLILAYVQKAREDPAMTNRDIRGAEKKMRVAAYDYLLQKLGSDDIEIIGQSKLENERDSIVRDIALTDPTWADLPLLRPYTSSGDEDDKRVCCAIPYRTIGGFSGRMQNIELTERLQSQEGFNGMSVISPGVVSLQDLESLAAEMGNGGLVKVYRMFGEGQVEIDVQKSLEASGYSHSRDYGMPGYKAAEEQLQRENSDPQNRIRWAQELGDLMSRSTRKTELAGDALGRGIAERNNEAVLDDPAWNI